MTGILRANQQIVVLSYREDKMQRKQEGKKYMCHSTWSHQGLLKPTMNNQGPLSIISQCRLPILQIEEFQILPSSTLGYSKLLMLFVVLLDIC